MNFEQIMLRVGVDAAAVTSGLQRTGAFVKGWATGLVHDLQHHTLGRFLGLAAVERGLETIKEKVLAIKRASTQSGFSTNFVQSAFKLLGAEGEEGEQLIKPLANLSALAGEKGMKGNELLKQMYDNWHKLNTQEERNAYLKSLGIKNWQVFIPIMEQTRKQFEAMEQGDFFTKLTPSTISNASELWGSIKAGSSGLLATIANVANAVTYPIRAFSRLAGYAIGSPNALSGADSKEAWRYTLHGDTAEKVAAMELANWKKQVGKDNLSNEEKLTQEYEKQKTLDHLNERIGDRTKLTVGALADRARAIMGDKMPRGLNSVYSITPAMASALQIQKLEDQAQVAAAYGNEGRAQELQSRADQLRASNTTLKSDDRRPAKEILEHKEHTKIALDIMNNTLDRVEKKLPPAAP